MEHRVGDRRARRHGGGAIRRTCLTLVATALLAVAAPASAEWTEPVGGASPVNADGTRDALAPALAELNGIPWVAWAEDTATSRQVRVATLVGGTDWVEPIGGAQPINTSATGFSETPSLTMFEGVPHVAFEEDGRVRVKRINAAGTAWEQLGNPFDPGRQPTLRVIDGVLTLAYSEPGPVELGRVRQWEAPVWVSLGGEAINVNGASGGVPDNPVLARLGDTTYAAWAEHVPPALNDTVRVALQDTIGDDWDEVVPGPLNVGASNPAGDVDIAVVGGELYVGWDETIGAVLQAFVAKLDIATPAWVLQAGGDPVPGITDGAVMVGLAEVNGALVVATSDDTGPFQVPHVHRLSPDGTQWDPVGTQPLPHDLVTGTDARSILSANGIPFLATTQDDGAGIEARVTRLQPEFTAQRTTGIGTASAMLEFDVETFGVNFPFLAQVDGLGTMPASPVLARSSPTGTTTAAVPANGLAPSTGYTWRALGSNGAYVAATSGDQSFRTADPPPPDPVPPAPAPIPFQAPPPPPPPPGPVAGQTIVAEPAAGTVKVKVRGTNRFVDLTTLRTIPVGSVVDARNGRVEIVAAGGASGVFYGGIFKVTQTSGANPRTDLTLQGKIGPCGKTRARTRAHAAAKAKRRLWGNAQGKMRTVGKHSAAIVRGTWWLVEDRCDGTLTRVREGSVTVEIFAGDKRRVVRAGGRFLAPSRRRG